jgi:GntR family transcriptional regulator
MQVVMQIRQRIKLGSLRDGDTIPSARKIANEWGVSLATATKVLAALRSEGLVRAVPGVGTIVSASESTKTSAKERVVSIRNTGRIYPPNERAQILAAELIPAPGHIADALGVDVSAQVIRRRRVTFRDDSPMSASTSWFAGDLAQSAPLLLVVERLKQGTPRYIEEQTGRVVASGRDQAAASSATEEEASYLGIDVGATVLRRRNWLYDTNGDVIEYGESVALSDRWVTYDYNVAS